MNCFKWRFNKMHYFGVLMGLNGPRAIKAEKGKRAGDSLAILREGFMPTNESLNLWKDPRRMKVYYHGVALRLERQTLNRPARPARPAWNRLGDPI